MYTVLKLGLPVSWQALSGEVRFPGVGRRVRLEVMAVFAGALHISDDGQGYAITVPVQHGMNVIEFDASGPVVVLFDGEGEAYWRAPGEEAHYVRTDGEASMVKLVQRKARNREMELMLYNMEQTMERRLELQRVEMEKRLQADPSRDPITNRMKPVEEEDIEDGAEGEEPEGGDEGQDEPGADTQGKPARK